MNKIEERKYYNYSDVLIKPCMTSLTSRKEPNIHREFCFQNAEAWTAKPIIISNMDTTGTIEMAKAVNQFGVIVALHKFYPTETIREFIRSTPYCNFVTVGIDDFDKLARIFFDGVPPNVGICLDVANGYMVKFLDFVKKVRDEYPKTVIMAGNICTPDMVLEYANAGADIIKVGIGQGGQCRTREVTGVGVPQLTAVMDCCEEANNFSNVMICADGGIVEIADFSKALVAGADFVMAGSFFAGTNEAAGEYTSIEGKLYRECYGMSSNKAHSIRYNNGTKKYKASEGRSSLVPYTGPVENLLDTIFGGIRSTMTYTDTRYIEDLYSASFIEVTDTKNRHHEPLMTGH